jgi:hypothetical protein
MPNNSSQDAQFIWADKAVVGLAVTWVLLSSVFWATAFEIIGDQGANYLWSRVGAKEFTYSFLGLAFVWLLLRLVDFAAAGVTYRCAVRTAAHIHVAVRQVAHALAEHRPQSFKGVPAVRG